MPGLIYIQQGGAAYFYNIYTKENSMYETYHNNSRGVFLSANEHFGILYFSNVTFDTHYGYLTSYFTSLISPYTVTQSDLGEMNPIIAIWSTSELASFYMDTVTF